MPSTDEMLAVAEARRRAQTAINKETKVNARDSMTTTKQPARIAKVTMTDKSIAYNVLAKLDGQEFVFACQTAGHADTLANAINQSSWIERS